MKRHAFRGGVWGLAAITAVSSLVIPAPVVRAGIAACSATITPHQVAPGSLTQFTLTVTNQDPDNDIQHILVLRPSADFTITNADSENWAVDDAPDQIIFDGSSIPAPDSQIFTIEAQAANSPTPAANWSVLVSDSPDGSGSQLCTQDTATAISSGAPLEISNVTVSAITPTTATISWTTNFPADGAVDYGLDSSYGYQVVGQASAATNHEVTLGILLPQTAYHFRATSEDQSGNSAVSGDSTFITLAATSNPVSSAPPTAASSGVVPGITVGPPRETISPSVTITTQLATAYDRAPELTGFAEDNSAIAAIDFSTDGGKNWLPVKISAVRDNATTVVFTFTPMLPQDGDYQLIVRATDSSGNQGVSAEAKLVIDQLPPQTGPVVISSGPQVLEPGSRGAVQIVAGANYRLTTKAVGGPTQMALEAYRVDSFGRRLNSGRPAHTFTMAESFDQGLWQGALSIENGGQYEIAVRAVDGAGNLTNRKLFDAQVTAAGKVLGSKAQIGQASVTVFTQVRPGQWRVWAGRPYGQTNPQVSRKDGQFSFVLPAGRYYLKVAAEGYATYTSDTFDSQSTVVVAPTIRLTPRIVLNIGGQKLAWPDINWQSQPFEDASGLSSSPERPPAAQFPAFSLPLTDGRRITNTSLLGKPSVLTVITTWDPRGQDQLAQLSLAARNQDVTVIPVFVGESAGQVKAYITAGGYNLAAATDPTGSFVASAQTGLAPQHIFFDRRGNVKKVMVKVLSSQDIMNQLGGR